MVGLNPVHLGSSEETWDTDSHRGKTRWGQRKKTANYKPRRDASADTSISASSLQNYEKNSSSLVCLDLWVLGVDVFPFLILRLGKSEESIVELLFLFWNGSGLSRRWGSCRDVRRRLVLIRLSGSKRYSEPVSRVWGKAAKDQKGIGPDGTFITYPFIYF